MNQQLVLRLADAAKAGDVEKFIDNAAKYYASEGLPIPEELTAMLHDDMTQEEKIRAMQKLTIEIHNATVAK